MKRLFNASLRLPLFKLGSLGIGHIVALLSAIMLGRMSSITCCRCFEPCPTQPCTASAGTQSFCKMISDSRSALSTAGSAAPFRLGRSPAPHRSSVKPVASATTVERVAESSKEARARSVLSTKICCRALLCHLQLNPCASLQVKASGSVCV